MSSRVLKVHVNWTDHRHSRRRSHPFGPRHDRGEGSKAKRELRRERLGERVGGHRQEADVHATKAQDHEETAREAAERAERERELARRHGEKADDLERKL